MMAMGPNIRFKIERAPRKNELQAATAFLHLGERHGHKLFSITQIQQLDFTIQIQQLFFYLDLLEIYPYLYERARMRGI